MRIEVEEVVDRLINCQACRRSDWPEGVTIAIWPDVLTNNGYRMPRRDELPPDPIRAMIDLHRWIMWGPGMAEDIYLPLAMSEHVAHGWESCAGPYDDA